jgi:hypothetical protein
VHSWLIKQVPELCHRSAFVDPVMFCLWEPHVCFNFLYSRVQTPLEWLMRYFVARELGVAVMLQRCFDWSANLLFAEDIPNYADPYRSSFFLAGRDSILSSYRIRNYLKHHGIDEGPGRRGPGPGWGGLKFFEDMKHGESVITRGSAFHHIMEWIVLEQDEVIGDNNMSE